MSETDGELTWIDPKRTLGYAVLEWMQLNLAQPDGENAGGPFTPVEYQAKFVVNFYAIDDHGEFTYRRALLSRPKGMGKSPLLAAMCCAELLGPTVFDYFDEDGYPVGKQRASAYIQIAATSESQTENTYELVRDMLKLGRASEVYDLDIGLTRTYFNGDTTGKIKPVTANSTSLEGQRVTFAVLDETGLWNKSNGGHKIAQAVERNLAKMNGRAVETTNAYVPGEGSVAERSAETYRAIREGRAVDVGVLHDHKEAPASVDVTDRDSLLHGLRELYSEAPWVEVEKSILPQFYDLNQDPQETERFFLNRVTHASDSWLSAPEWNACFSLDKRMEYGDVITLGFDGSRQRARGITDATALVGCRVSDGHLFEIKVWEQPEGPAGEGWAVPKHEVEAAIAEIFEDYNVIAFYADPNKWETDVSHWESTYGARLQVKLSADRPVQFWPTQVNRMVRATEALYNAITQQQITHDGSWALSRHMLNARRRASRQGIQISKEHPTSWRKIDAAIASILAYKARMDALSKGVTLTKTKKKRTLIGMN